MAHRTQQPRRRGLAWVPLGKRLATAYLLATSGWGRASGRSGLTRARHRFDGARGPTDVFEPAHRPNTACRGPAVAPAPPREPCASPTLEIVVAHFDEDLRWLADHRDVATIYCKGAEPPALGGAAHVVRLPNVGCESHSYLHHIVTHYDRLANLTVFSQGRIDDSVEDFQSLDALLQQARQSPTDMTIFRAPLRFDAWDGLSHFGKWEREVETGSLRLADTSPGRFWRWMFDGSEPPESIVWVHAATFSVSRRAIHGRPLRFYARLLRFFDALNQTRPEEGHYMERFWMSIFDPNRTIA